MAKIVQAMALCALMAASTTAVSVRGRRRSGGERQLQTTRADTTKTFEVRGPAQYTKPVPNLRIVLPRVSWNTGGIGRDAEHLGFPNLAGDGVPSRVHCVS